MTPPDSEIARHSSSHNDRLAEIVLREMREFRSEVGSRLDKLVTQEAFQAEKERVNERLNDVREDLSNERAAREKAVKDEATAREKSAADEAAARAKAIQAQEEKRMAIEVEQEKASQRFRWMLGVALIPMVFMIGQYVLNNLGGSTP